MGLLISVVVLVLGMTLIHIANDPYKWEWYCILGVMLASVGIVGTLLFGTVAIFG